jgi:hypothetical protein
MSLLGEAIMSITLRFCRHARGALLKTSFIAFLGIAFICGVPKAGIAVSITFNEPAFQALPNLASLNGMHVGDTGMGLTFLNQDYLARDARFTEDHVGVASENFTTINTGALEFSFDNPVNHVSLDVLTIGGVNPIQVELLTEFASILPPATTLPSTDPSTKKDIVFDETGITGLRVFATGDPTTRDAAKKIGIDCITFSTSGTSGPVPSNCPDVVPPPVRPPIDCNPVNAFCSEFIVLPIGTVEPEPVPEPATIFLLSSSLLVLFIYRLRRRQSVLIPSGRHGPALIQTPRLAGG